jgi:hypothetical protein
VLNNVITLHLTIFPINLLKHEEIYYWDHA